MFAIASFPGSPRKKAFRSASDKSCAEAWERGYCFAMQTNAYGSSLYEAIGKSGLMVYKHAPLGLERLFVLQATQAVRRPGNEAIVLQCKQMHTDRAFTKQLGRVA